jgi:hypothetical protein
VIAAAEQIAGAERTALAERMERPHRIGSAALIAVSSEGGRSLDPPTGLKWESAEFRELVG